MPISQNLLDLKQLQRLQSLLLWLRLASVLFFVICFWQLVVAVGLLSSLGFSGFFQLSTSFAFGFLGKVLWDSSRLVETINDNLSVEELNKILLGFADSMLLFFKWSVLILIVATVVSLLLIVIGFLLVITSGQWTNLPTGG